MNIRDHMTPTPTVRSDAPMATAVDLIIQHGLRILPVVDDNNRFVGHLEAADGPPIRRDPILKDFPVFHFTRYGASVIDADAPNEAAARLFEDNPRVEALVVLSKGRVAGLLTRDTLEDATFAAASSTGLQRSMPTVRRQSPAECAHVAESMVCVETAPDSSIWLG